MTGNGKEGWEAPLSCWHGSQQLISKVENHSQCHWPVMQGGASGINATLHIPPGSGPGRTAVSGDNARGTDAGDERRKVCLLQPAEGEERSRASQLGFQLEHMHTRPHVLTGTQPHSHSATLSHTHTHTHSHSATLTRAHTDTQSCSDLQSHQQCMRNPIAPYPWPCLVAV